MNVKLNKKSMQLTNPNLPELTGKENTAYSLNGAGLQTKEIADKMGVGYETVKSYMKAIKQKLGLNKDKEITAHFWCNMMDRDFSEIKKQIISSCLLLIMILYAPFDASPMRGRVRNTRSIRTCISVSRRDFTTI